MQVDSLWGYVMSPGMSAAERAVVRRETWPYIEGARDIVNAHLRWLRRQQVPRCLRDAVRADKRVAKGWLDILVPDNLPNQSTPDGRWAAAMFEDADAAARRFINRIDQYSADC